MAKCCTDDASGSTNGFRLWTPSFPKRLFEVIACGSCSSRRHRRWKREIETVGVSVAEDDFKDYSGSQKDHGVKKFGSEKLSDFLSLSCTEIRTAAAGETEALKRVVAMFSVGGAGVRVEEAASEVRRLAKDDASARSVLAALGAIPPLVGMIDCQSDVNDASKIAALYALLNLGIQNDL